MRVSEKQKKQKKQTEKLTPQEARRRDREKKARLEKIWTVSAIGVVVLLVVGIVIGFIVSGMTDEITPIAPSEQDLKVVATSGGYDILYEDLYFITMNYKAAMEQTYGKGIWDNPETAEQYRAELEKSVWDNINADAAILASANLVAYGVTDIKDSDVQKAVEDVVNNNYGGSMSAYKKGLAGVYMTDHYFRTHQAVTILEANLLDLYIEAGLIEDDDAAVRQAILDTCFCVEQVGFLTGDSVQSNFNTKEKVEALIAQHTFEELYQYQTDSGKSGTVYYYMPGELTSQFEEAVSKLAIGEVSGVEENYSGFFVFRRAAADEGYVDTYLNRAQSVAINSQALTLKQQYQLSILNQTISEAQKNMPAVLTEYGKTIDLIKMK